MEGMKLTDGFGTEAGGVTVHLSGVQEVNIGGLDHHSIVYPKIFIIDLEALSQK